MTDLEARIGGLLDADDRQGAVVESIRGYGPEILGYLFVTLRNEAAAEDAFSAFSEDLWKTIDRGAFRRECSMRTWCYKLAWEAAKRYLRDPFLRRKSPLGSAAWASVADEVRDKTAPHLRTTVKSRLDKLRSQLKPTEQTLLTLRLDRGLSWTEIAEVLRPVSEATLRKRWERLKESLRALAEEDGLLPPET